MSRQLDSIVQILGENPGRSDSLFCRGYFFTDSRIGNRDGFPFFVRWNEQQVGGWWVYTHPFTDAWFHAEANKTYVLIGHAFDPFAGLSDEAALLKRAAAAATHSHDSYFATVSDWTGRFVTGVIEGDRIQLVQDCAGMRALFYGKIDSGVYLASHAQLIGDLCGLDMDPAIERLISSPAYSLGIRFLPGDLSAFAGVKRLGPNLSLQYDGGFNLKRFYPSNEIAMVLGEEASIRTVQKIGDLLHQSMQLIAGKWRRPAISLTGGTDSQTTLAAAKDLDAEFRYFSFNSNKEEAHDLSAAQNICAALGLKHDAYLIPESSADIPDFDVFKAIIHHNAAYVRQNAANDLRKMAFFATARPYDVDVKSWVSEIGRAFFSKRLWIPQFPRHLTSRHLSILYKRIFFDRRLLHFIDDAFDEWIDVTGFGKQFFNFESSDMFYWEHRLSGWGALCLNEFDMCWDTTTIFNNRRIVELFLSFPREERVSDLVHMGVVHLLRPALFKSRINVSNLDKNRARVLLERVFFEVNSRLP